MRRTRLFSWLLCTGLAFSVANCGSETASCPPISGNDRDQDGLDDSIEQCVGSDLFNPDSDGDGINDGVEYNYPKICVAGDSALQRRSPVPTCSTSADCAEGESCRGLDPTRTDSDGDGVPDAQEDINFDGSIDPAMGETDPRLVDTNGDGTPDSMDGSAICRPDGLGMVVQQSVGPIQIGHDPLFGTARTISGTAANKSAVALDEDATGVAALVVGTPALATTLTNDRIAAEAAVRTALTTAGYTVTDVFIGRQFTTHELNPAVQSTLRVTRATASSAGTLRDLVVSGLTGGTAPTGGGTGPGSAFYADITTVRRTSSNYDDIIVAFSPTALYDDNTKLTAIRVTDLVNASGVAEAGKTLDYKCQYILTNRIPTADIIWTVDISQSMGGNQARLASTASTFFQRLQTAGVDFRVGIFNAFSTLPALNTTTYAGFPSGFAFTPGTAGDGPLQICRYVTSPESGTAGFCPLDNPKTNDMAAPFGVPNGANANEEPVSAAILVDDQFTKNATDATVTNANWKWRPDATKVAFFVTDESGGNDFNRYIKSADIPGSSPPVRFAPAGTFNGTVLANVIKHFKDRGIMTFGSVPVSARLCSANNVADLPRCVIEGGGGAYVDVDNSTDQDVASAMNRLVDAIAGASSQFKLLRTPITHTIKVTVRNQVVPRSRKEGFDYDTASRSIVFYGTQYRPVVGDTVYISYRVWATSSG